MRPTSRPNMAKALARISRETHRLIYNATRADWSPEQRSVLESKASKALRKMQRRIMTLYGITPEAYKRYTKK